MNNIFVGTEARGFFIKELNIGNIYYTGVIDLSELKSLALGSDYQCIIIDISIWETINDAVSISDLINDMAANTHSKLIIFAPGYDHKSVLLTELRKYGIYNVITSGSLGDIKSDFFKLYKSSDTTIDRVVNEPVDDIVLPKVNTIAVVGAQERIGTTTQCFQIVKYLTAKGLKAAYVEFNNNQFLSTMRKLFNISTSAFEGITLISQEEITEMLREFDYLVYDYGSIKDKSFNKYSFIERNIKIICCGASPSEIEYSTKALSAFQQYDDINYIFTFVSEADKSDIKAQMTTHPTFFAPLIPDAFSLLNDENVILNSIINAIPAVPKAEKRSLFKRRRK